MSYGLSITNSSGTVLIADDEMVPRFIMKYAIPNGVSTVNTGLPSTELPPISFQAGGFAQQRFYASNGVWMIEYNKIMTTNNAVVAYIFGNKLTSSQYGLRIFNSKGGVAYESTSRSVRVMGIFGAGALSLPQTYSVPVAVLPKIIGWQSSGGGGPGGGPSARTMAICSKGTTVTSMVAQNIPTNIGNATLNVTSVAIDITGL